MPLTSNDWNVVVIGHWNRAILSPAGIAKRLFELPEGTPVQVLVPLDVVAPYHIRHENVTVIPSNDRLVAQPAHNSLENLVEAITIIRRALEDLPRTPVFAAGLNLGYKSENGIEAIQRITESSWDDRIDESSLVVASRSITRSINWRDGKINSTVTQEPNGPCSILLNFEFLSQEVDKLKQWLNLTAVDIQTQVDLILRNTIGLSPEDFSND